VVAEIGRIIRLLHAAGQTILLVEQNVRMALRAAEYVYVIRNGRIVLEGEAAGFSDRDGIFRSYIG
jgi:branched-chain amino acid transport system ATP-binding protein